MQDTTDHTYKFLKEDKGVALLRRSDGKYCVVHVDRKSNQVYSAIPGDQPREGGSWYGSLTPSGISYVAGGYSESYARRMFRQFTAS